MSGRKVPGRAKKLPSAKNELVQALLGQYAQLLLFLNAYMLHDTSGRFPGLPDFNGSVEVEHPGAFARAMAESDFCLSPLGQSEGAADPRPGVGWTSERGQGQRQ